MGSADTAQTATVVCLKWGDLYGPDYVNILYRMVRRHLSLPLRFICFTEKPQGIIDEVEIQPLPVFPEPEWQYARYCSAWRKLALFEKGLADIQGRVLFLDLDVVIVDSIDCFFQHPAPFAMIENWYQPGRNAGQASVMCFDSGYPERLLKQYLKAPENVLQRYRTEQAYIAAELAGTDDIFFPKAWCKSFKKHCLPSGFKRFWRSRIGGIPAGARVMVFHGRPNPPDAMRGEWGKAFPWYKRWYKRLSPCPWVAEHWC